MTTNSKYDKLVTRIFWFSLPLIISFLAYLVITTFTVKEEVAKVATAHEADVAMDGRMWELIQENNKILNRKADQETNDREHQALLKKLNDVEIAIDKVYKKQGVYGKKYGNKSK